MASDKKDIVTKLNKSDGHKLLGLDEIQALLETLEKHEVTEFQLEREDEKLWLKRGPKEATHNTFAAPYPQPFYSPPQYPSNVAPGQSSDTPQVPTSTSPIAAALKPVSKNLKEIRSPMVGTFYRRPAVDAEPFIDVGDQIKKGSVLCIIEAMKLMNEIDSEFSGKVLEICLEDGQMVEYGEVIFKIEQS